jgi:hypothetical protein
MEPFTRIANRVGKDDQLSAAARLLFAALDSFLDKRTGSCSPSLNRLAGWIGCSSRHVKNLLKDLERAGYVRIDRSAGRRNSYVLLPQSDGQTGEPQFPTTGEPQFPTTGEPQFPGSTDLDRIGVKNKRERTSEPRPLDLFHDHHRAWFTDAVRYYLGDVPELADLIGWFPQLVGDFFLARSWHRTTDPETAVEWAKRLNAITATQAEAAEAFAWSLSSPATDGAGRKVFSRPDHLDRIVARIKSQRQRQRDRSATVPEREAAAEPSRQQQIWSSATDAEREEVSARVRRRHPDIVPGGLRWISEVVNELTRLRGRPPATAGDLSDQ